MFTISPAELFSTLWETHIESLITPSASIVIPDNWFTKAGIQVKQYPFNNIRSTDSSDSLKWSAVSEFSRGLDRNCFAFNNKYDLPTLVNWCPISSEFKTTTTLIPKIKWSLDRSCCCIILNTKTKVVINGTEHSVNYFYCPGATKWSDRQFWQWSGHCLLGNGAMIARKFDGCDDSTEFCVLRWDKDRYISQHLDKLSTHYNTFTKSMLHVHHGKISVRVIQQANQFCEYATLLFWNAYSKHVLFVVINTADTTVPVWYIHTTNMTLITAIGRYVYLQPGNPRGVAITSSTGLTVVEFVIFYRFCPICDQFWFRNLISFHPTLGRVGFV